jgi:hypothetical protein
MTRRVQAAESSVNFALRELLGMEDERQLREEEAARRREAEARARREEERRQDEEERALRRRQEEQARLAAERAAREEGARRLREEEERRLRIRLEAEARTRADEQERLLRHAEELKRIDAQRAGIPGWTVGVAAAVLALGLGGGLAWHYGSVVPGREAQERALEADRERQRQEAAEMMKTLAALQVDLDNARREQEEARLRLELATTSRDEAAIENAKQAVEKAERHHRTARERIVRKGGGGAAGSATELSRDPLDDGIVID